MTERDIPLPLSFRGDLLDKVMPLLRSGESCSLLGVSGVGKSNLVRFIQRADVQQHYWGSALVWVVPIDTHSLVFGEYPDEYVVVELMMHRLLREAEKRQAAETLIDDLNQKYLQLVERPNAQLAIRYLERMCGRLCENQGIQLLFVFDQFEDLWKKCAPRLFLNLRHLRDEFKYQLAYLTTSRDPLRQFWQRERGDATVTESFWEMFSAHTYGIGMYNDADAQFMLDRIAKRRSIQIPDPIRAHAIERSGNHPALLRAVCWALIQHPTHEIDDHTLLNLDSIHEECDKIWNDLLPDEKLVVRQLVSGSNRATMNIENLSTLRLKGIIDGEPVRLFSPLMAAYVERSVGDIKGIILLPRQRQVLIDGELLERTLSALEFRLLEHLARHVGEVRKREDILQALYGEDSFDANDERLDALLRRLRDALKEDARNPRYLITHRGAGLQLVNARVEE